MICDEIQLFIFRDVTFSILKLEYVSYRKMHRVIDNMVDKNRAEVLRDRGQNRFSISLAVGNGY